MPGHQPLIALEGLRTKSLPSPERRWKPFRLLADNCKTAMVSSYVSTKEYDLGPGCEAHGLGWNVPRTTMAVGQVSRRQRGQL